MVWLKSLLSKDEFVFFLVYTLSFGLYLLNTGVYTDDWELTGNTPENFRLMYDMMGLYWMGSVYNVIESLAPFHLLAYRLLTFFCYFAAGLFLNGILKTIKEIDSVSRVYLVLLFLIMPVNHVRFFIGVLTYTLCHFLFFAGFWMMKKYLEQRQVIWRILALVVLFLSLSTNSLVLFYGIVLLYLVYRQGEGLGWQKFKSLRKFPDFLILPVLFVFLRLKFLVPYGPYEGLNRIELTTFALAPIRFIPSLYSLFFEPLDVAASLIFVSPTLVLFAAFLLFLWLKPKSFAQGVQKPGTVLWVSVGMMVLFLGSFPYLAVGKVPQLAVYQDRHLLLVPLGAALLLYYGLRAVFDKLRLTDDLRHFFYCLLLSLFVFCNFDSNVSYQRDWYHQLSVQQFFSDHIELKESSSFLVDDRTLSPNDPHQSRLAGLSGMGRLAYGDKKSRFFYDENSFSPHKLSRDFNYFIMDYQTPEKPQYRLIIRPGVQELSRKQVLKLIALEWLQPNRFQEVIRAAVTVEAQPLSR